MPAARVQLHACRASGSGGGAAAEYETLASADIPLRTLLEPGGWRDEGRADWQVKGPEVCFHLNTPRVCHAASAGGARQYQRCELLRSDGRPCGTLQYALAALKPVQPHPAASVLATAAPAQPPSSSVGDAAAGGPLRQPRLSVRVVGCRSLRPPHGTGSGMRPYVALLLPAAAAAAGRQAVFETRPAVGGGADPAFDQQAAFAVSGEAAARGLTLEAAVFDDAAGSGADAIIGTSHISVPPAGSGGRGSGATTLQPLLHPSSGRHAGVLELAVGWE